MHTKSSSSILRPRFFIPPRMALIAFAFGTTLAFSPLPGLRAAQDDSAQMQASADNDSYRLFYDKLGDGGEWFQTDKYGYVFQPRVAQDKSWRPYTDGYWAQTDSGWAWVSNEDFGWATYHYGRWTNIVDTGWVWVPGADWSPGYVSWRISKDHKRIGWAPLPPEAQVSSGEAIEGWVDTAYDIGPDAYCFIDTQNFGDTSYRTHLLPFDQNATIIVETENVTRVNYRTVESRSVVYNGGPEVTVIREATGHPVRELKLETRPENVEFFERGDRRRITEVNGNRLVVAIAGPDVIRSNSIRVKEPAHIEHRLTNVTVDRGYRGIRDQQQAEHLRETLRSQNPTVPPQVQRRVGASIPQEKAPLPTDRQGNRPPGERNAASTPERNAASTPERNAASTPAVHNEATPAASASPSPDRATPRHNQPDPRHPGASPGVSPAHTPGGSPVPTPKATPERAEREHGHSTATPASSSTPHTSATPESTRSERPEKQTQASPTPPKREVRENQPEKSTTPAAKASPAARESEGNERKPASTKPESQPTQHRTPEEGREKPVENRGSERAEKREAPTAPAGEKEKATPKP